MEQGNRWACKELGIRQRTLQRWRSDLTPNEDQRPLAERTIRKNKLTDKERETIIQMVNQPVYQSLPPSQLFRDLLMKESILHPDLA